MLKLVDYDSNDEGDAESSRETESSLEEIRAEAQVHSTSAEPPFSAMTTSSMALSVCCAPDVVPIGNDDGRRLLQKNAKEISYNMTYDELFAPEVGPTNPFLSSQQRATRNILSGFVEKAHLNEFAFENQRRTFSSFGYAIDPSVGTDKNDTIVARIPDVSLAPAMNPGDNMVTVFEKTAKRPKTRKTDDQPPVTEEKKENAVLPVTETYDLPDKKKRKKNEDQSEMEGKTILHIKDAYDYQGRSFLHPPHDVGTNLRSDAAPSKCFLPKSHIHTWTGHTKGISAIRWFPRSAHLLLSSSMDSRVKIWEVYHDRRCIRTYHGHREAVRDVCFNNEGDQFLSASYDRYIKLWDTETGSCISSFTSRKVPFCVKFNPDTDKQHLFVAGTSDKKIICWDTRSGETVQEYDRHLGAVNSITFVDENRRFVTTSDDKSLRVWEWDIPVDMKYIADPSMHSMPTVTCAPNNKWLACQSMDNKIVIFSALNRFKLNRKKTFEGHMVAGYACSLDFSPDMSYIVSGDADGKCYVWDWKTTKLFKKWKAHDSVCISALWHPHETSKVVTAGWDGKIKYWD